MIQKQDKSSSFPGSRHDARPFDAPSTHAARVAGSAAPGSSSVPVANQRYIGELDGIRALAVAFVVAAHYGLGFIVPGGFGVTLFFFLSGYLITTLFFAEYHETAAISIRQFYLRRWLRLTPPLVIAVLLAAFFHTITRDAVGGSPMPIGATLAALFYFTNYYDLYQNMAPFVLIPLGICWSLAVEEHFYLIWPWITRRKIGDPERLCLIIIGVCVAVLAWRFVARNVLGLSSNYTYLATDARIDSILYGALLRTLFETSWAETAVRVLRLPIVRILAALALLSTFVIRNDNFRETLRYSIQGIALMPFFTAVLVLEPKNPLRRMLATPSMVLIGRLSYSIYLFHFLALYSAQAYFGSEDRAGWVTSGLLLTGLISFTLFIFVERPIAGLRRRLRSTTKSGGDSPARAVVAEVPLIHFTNEPMRGR